MEQGTLDHLCHMKIAYHKVNNRAAHVPNVSFQLEHMQWPSEEDPHSLVWKVQPQPQIQNWWQDLDQNSLYAFEKGDVGNQNMYKKYTVLHSSVAETLRDTIHAQTSNVQITGVV